MEGVTVKQVAAKEELQEVFRRAQAARTPVSAYRNPVPGGIALDFGAWKDIEAFDIDNLMVIVPPGVLLKDLNAVVSEKGLRFMPADTPLMESLSVGEWAYRGCPNASAWKYGAGKHFLLGATYVFPNGDVAPVGGKCIKNVTGYDFTRFFTGAYTDLAVGVQYIIKLMPQPEYRYRYDVTLATLEQVTTFVDQLHSRSVPPAWLYWFDEATGSRLFGNPQRGQRMLFEMDGNEAEVCGHVETIDKLLADIDCQKASDSGHLPNLSFIESQADSFWLLDEFKLPRQEIGAFAGSFAVQLKNQQASGGLFGQLADGKIHLFFDRPLSPATKTIIRELQENAKAFGGTASGKFARLYGEEAAGPLAGLEAAVRKIVDPELIFNRREGLQ